MERKMIQLVWCRDDAGINIMTIAPAFEHIRKGDSVVVSGEICSVVSAANIWDDNEAYMIMRPFIEEECNEQEQFRRIEAAATFRKMEYREEDKNEALSES